MSVWARDTVNIDESVHDIYRQLTEGSDPVNAPFKTMKDVFLWAASLGFKKKERRPISGKRITIFRWAQFNSNIDIPIIKAIALSDTEDIGLLMSQDRILDSIEEYANSGVYELKSQLSYQGVSSLWDVTSMIK